MIRQKQQDEGPAVADESHFSQLKSTSQLSLYPEKVESFFMQMLKMMISIEIRSLIIQNCSNIEELMLKNGLRCLQRHKGGSFAYGQKRISN